MADERGILRDKQYSQAYYDEHVEAGLDYLAYGEWHESYALMVAEATLQTDFVSPAVLDAGCACGAQLQGFRKSGLFKKVLGIDMSSAMIEMGKSHFGFSSAELMAGSIEHIPLQDEDLTLINSGQVLEHIPDELIDSILAEFFRVLVPGGRTFHNLAALKRFDALDIHDGDPTHVNVKPTMYWAEKFAKAGFLPDFESYDRFVRSKYSPGAGYPNFFSTYEIWTTVAYMKPAS